jgi:hypothetical protein
LPADALAMGLPCIIASRNPQFTLNVNSQTNSFLFNSLLSDILLDVLDMLPEGDRMRFGATCKLGKNLVYRHSRQAHSALAVPCRELTYDTAFDAPRLWADKRVSEDYSGTLYAKRPSWCYGCEYCKVAWQPHRDLKSLEEVVVQLSQRFLVL